MRGLRRLTANRRLFDQELYEAAWLLSECIAQCYEEVEDDRHSHTMGSQAHGSQAHSALELDQTDKLCLLLVGRVKTVAGQPLVTFIEVGCNHYKGAHKRKAALPPAGSTVWLGTEHFKVASADAKAGTLTLNKPVKAANDDAWLQIENRITEPNHDAQLLLVKLDAHKAALRLLDLPFTMEAVLPAEAPIRALLCATYRLLKAMCLDFPLVCTYCSDSPHSLCQRVSERSCT